MFVFLRRWLGFCQLLQLKYNSSSVLACDAPLAIAFHTLHNAVQTSGVFFDYMLHFLSLRGIKLLQTLYNRHSHSEVPPSMPTESTLHPSLARKMTEKNRSKLYFCPAPHASHVVRLAWTRRATSATIHTRKGLLNILRKNYIVRVSKRCATKLLTSPAGDRQYTSTRVLQQNRSTAGLSLLKVLFKKQYAQRTMPSYGHHNSVTFDTAVPSGSF